jgi:UMF1 family MFS transporter
MKLTKTERSWALYDWANSAYTIAVTTTIFPLYFKAAAEKTGVAQANATAYLGFANSISSLFLAVLSPFLGTIADYYGYKKNFFGFFTFLGVLLTAVLAFIPESQWLLMLGIYMISALGFSGSNIFYDAFLVDVTTEDRMDYVSTMGYALGYIGSTIPFIICMALIITAYMGLIPIGFYLASKIGFVITAIWWGYFTLPMLKNVQQIHGIPREANPIRKSFKRLAVTFKNIKAHKPLFMFLLAYFFYIDGVDTIIKMATAYGSDLGIDANSLLVILLVTQFVAFPFAILYGKLSAKYKGKTMLYVAIIAYTFICIYAYFLKTTLDFWILAILVGTQQGGIQALSRSYFAKLVPKESANEFFGFYNIFGKFAAIIGPALMSFVTLMTGKTNAGVLSIAALFIIGGILFAMVPEENQSDPTLT